MSISGKNKNILHQKPLLEHIHEYLSNSFITRIIFSHSYNHISKNLEKPKMRVVNAPAEVDEIQLRELHIKVRESGK